MTRDNSISFGIRSSLLIDIIWHLVFTGAFLVSGALSALALMLGVPYRMALWSLLVLPIFVLRRIRLSAVIIAYGLLALVVVVSGLLNGSSLLEILLFTRVLVFSFLIYVLVRVAVSRDNAARVYRWCLSLAIVQLPIVLIQRLLYESMPTAIKVSVSRVDFGFGTFNLKGDAAMSFFVTMVVLLILFHGRGRVSLRRQWFVLPWLSLTVLLANSEVMKPLLFLIWGFYLITHPREKLIVNASLLLVLAIGGLAVTGGLSFVWSKLVTYLPNNLNFSSSGEAAFLAGSYGRGAAIAYYIRRGISLFGDGPSSYYSPLNRQYLLGNRGHIFTFYSEIGLLGWLSSVLVLFGLAFLDPSRPWSMRWSWLRFLVFVSIMALSYTTEVMNDISVFLAYALTLRLHMLMGRGTVMVTKADCMFPMDSENPNCLNLSGICRAAPPYSS